MLIDFAKNAYRLNLMLMQQIIPFYNKPIEKPVKRLKHIDPLAEQISVIKANEAFKGYALSNKVKIVERKDSIVQLEASKLSIKNLFSYLLNETKGFKYQTTVEILLKNTNIMEKLNLDGFILIQQQKQ